MSIKTAELAKQEMMSQYSRQADKHGKTALYPKPQRFTVRTQKGIEIHVKSLVVNFALENFQIQDVLPPEPPPEKPKPGMQFENKKAEKNKNEPKVHVEVHAFSDVRYILEPDEDGEGNTAVIYYIDPKIPTAVLRFESRGSREAWSACMRMALPLRTFHSAPSRLTAEPPARFAVGLEEPYPRPYCKESEYPQSDTSSFAQSARRLIPRNAITPAYAPAQISHQTTIIQPRSSGQGSDTRESGQKPRGSTTDEGSDAEDSNSEFSKAPTNKYRRTIKDLLDKANRHTEADHVDAYRILHYKDEKEPLDKDEVEEAVRGKFAEVLVVKEFLKARREIHDARSQRTRSQQTRPVERISTEARVASRAGPSVHSLRGSVYAISGGIYTWDTLQVDREPTQRMLTFDTVAAASIAAYPVFRAARKASSESASDALLRQMRGGFDLAAVGDFFRGLGLPLPPDDPSAPSPPPPQPPNGPVAGRGGLGLLGAGAAPVGLPPIELVAVSRAGLETAFCGKVEFGSDTRQSAAAAPAGDEGGAEPSHVHRVSWFAGEGSVLEFSSSDVLKKAFLVQFDQVMQDRHGLTSFLGLVAEIDDSGDLDYDSDPHWVFRVKTPTWADSHMSMAAVVSAHMVTVHKGSEATEQWVIQIAETFPVALAILLILAAAARCGPPNDRQRAELQRIAKQRHAAAEEERLARARSAAEAAAREKEAADRQHRSWHLARQRERASLHQSRTMSDRLRETASDN